jgi:hypothetical protein
MSNNALSKGMITLLSSVAGTTAMTIFSYWASRNKKEQFREPELLAEFIARLQNKKVNKKHTAAGFLLHYMTGLMFSAVFTQFWKFTPFKPNLKSGIMLGGLAAIDGLMVWKMTKELHPDPPKIPYKKHFMHLIPAHVIFGAVQHKTAQWLEA